MLEYGQASISMLQRPAARRLCRGLRASWTKWRCAESSAPFEGSKARQVLITHDMYEEMFGTGGGIAWTTYSSTSFRWVVRRTASTRSTCWASCRAATAVIVDEPKDADVIIVNTCGFIHEAKQESIDTILEMAKYKESGAALIVTGCLAQRYAKELQVELPRGGRFSGRCRAIAVSATRSKRYWRVKSSSAATAIDSDIRERVLTTPGHLAYVRIADGCSNHCSYCAIPIIRGELRSRSMESILTEVTELRESGVAEVILIAQDTTRYGEDPGRACAAGTGGQGGRDHAGRLAAPCCTVIPTGVTDKLIEAMLRHDNVCRYIDLPLQHFSDSVLKRMNRRQTCAALKEACG